MKRVRRVFLGFFVSSVSLSAHEVATHQNIGNAALVYLQSQYPNRPSLAGSLTAAQSLLRTGAQAEDAYYVDPLGPLGRFFFHFTPALSDFIGVAATANGCSSEYWGFVNLAACQENLGVASITGTNTFGWNQALTADPITGAPTTNGIDAFGYVVHLLEDLGSPPHTRSDAHFCLPLIGMGPYCDLFEHNNDGADPQALPAEAGYPFGYNWSYFLNSSPVIPTQGFTNPQKFFDALQQYVLMNYYSDRTVGMNGFTSSGTQIQVPPLAVNDGQYIWAPCIPVVSLNAGTCFTITLAGNTYIGYRKVAHAGPSYQSSCVSACDATLLDIDNTIAHEQFAELGPVIAQHVAAFVQFYAPALKVQIQGNGTVTSNPGNGINCSAGTCSALFLQGATITLTATPPLGSTVTWTGDCVSSGMSNTAQLMLTSDKACTATCNGSKFSAA